MRKIVILMMCVWMLASCQESGEEAMLRLVNEWNGKEIKFPSRSVFTIQGKDTVDFEFKDADYKVVTYIDSVGCTSCKLQLHRWKQLVAEVDSLTGGVIQSLESITIEALANLEGDDPGMGAPYLKCYCALMSDNSCAVNNNGSSVCAGGYNVKCWDYDRNCN